MKEDLKSLEQFEIVVPAKDLHEAIVKQTEALKSKPVNEKRLRELRLAVSSLNALIKAYGTKVGYFRVIAVSEKLKVAQKYSKRLKKKKS